MLCMSGTDATPRDRIRRATVAAVLGLIGVVVLFVAVPVTALSAVNAAALALGLVAAALGSGVLRSRVTAASKAVAAAAIMLGLVAGLIGGIRLGQENHRATAGYNYGQ